MWEKESSMCLRFSPSVKQFTCQTLDVFDPNSGMWSCDRTSKNSGPIAHVLNGNYPEAALKRMSVNGLEELVSKLVECTADACGRPSRKPKWWPSTIHFNRAIDFRLQHDSKRLALKQLIENCSLFFKNYSLKKTQWLSHWNDENRKALKRLAMEMTDDDASKRKKIKISPASSSSESQSPSQQEFLKYFKLDMRTKKIGPNSVGAVSSNTLKFTSSANIPFSSDIGRLMATREHHQMPEDLKLKRLEKSEWYINKSSQRASDVNWETGPYKQPDFYHKFTPPKRQYWQKRETFNSPDFLKQFCKPLVVNLERLNLNDLKKEEKKLVVFLERKQLCCDSDKPTKNLNLRTSPRFKSN